MRHISVSVPEDHLDAIAAALEDLKGLCPRHGKQCQRILVAVDRCQLQLLGLMDLVIHGRIEVEVAEGRPVDLHQHFELEGLRVTQNFRAGKDDLEKMSSLSALMRLTDRNLNAARNLAALER